jgi:hypothetical protein
MKNLAVQMSRPELKSKWMLMCQKKLLNVIIDIVVQWAPLNGIVVMEIKLSQI